MYVKVFRRCLKYLSPTEEDGNYCRKEGTPSELLHFYDLVCDPTREVFTTVNQAFVAEALEFAAMKAAQEDRYVAVDTIIPPDLRAAYASAYPTENATPEAAGIQ